MDLVKGVLEHLKSLGWRLDDIVDLAYKDYRTYVGVKTATINVLSMHNGIVLYGNYWSEGRNILESAGGYILAPGIKLPDVLKAVDVYLVEVERRISESYAVKLLKNS